MTATNVDSSEELWKDIPGYEGYYQVSNLGRVKSLPRAFKSAVGEMYYEERIMKRRVYSSGYEYVGLSMFGKVTKFKVHRLVAICFIPNPENKPQIDHINTVRGDNRATNLRWATHSENQMNPITSRNRSISKTGDLNPMKSKRKPVAQYDEDMNLIARWDGIKVAARAMGLDSSCISRACTGKKSSYKGFIWRFATSPL